MKTGYECKNSVFMLCIKGFRGSTVHGRGYVARVVGSEWNLSTERMEMGGGKP